MPKPPAQYLDEIIRRAERLEEWTEFEHSICLLRANLHHFIEPLQYQLKGAGPATVWREDLYEGQVRKAWQDSPSRTIPRLFLESFPKDFKHIGCTLDGDPHPAVLWVQDLRNLAREIETAIGQANSIPLMRDGCNRLQASVIYCLGQYGKTVKKEITELVFYTIQIRGREPLTRPSSLPQSTEGVAP